MVVATVALLGAHPAQAHHDRAFPPAAGCIQAWNTDWGGAFADTSFGNVMVGSPCRFKATETGGYRVLGGDRWQVTIERPDGTYRFLSSRAGSPTCMTNVIRRWDRVEVGADVGIVAGAGIGC